MQKAVAFSFFLHVCVCDVRQRDHRDKSARQPAQRGGNPQDTLCADGAPEKKRLCGFFCFYVVVFFAPAKVC